MKKLSLSLCAAALLMSLSACDDTMDPNDPQSVRKYLDKQKIAVTGNNFVNAAASGDTAKMTLFLQAAFEIDTPNDGGNNAVAILVNKGNVEMLKWVFAHGAKANVTNGNGESVLDNAVSMGPTHVEVVKLLLEQLKAEGVEYSNLTSAVIYAAKTGNVEMLRILGDAGVPLENRGADGYYPIHLAVKGGHYDALMYLIEKKVDVNVKCKQGYSVLDWAKNEGYTRLIAAVKKAGGKHTPEYVKEFGK